MPVSAKTPLIVTIFAPYLALFACERGVTAREGSGTKVQHIAAFVAVLLYRFSAIRSRAC
jgi:hypothetical protein